MYTHLLTPTRVSIPSSYSHLALLGNTPSNMRSLARTAALKVLPACQVHKGQKLKENCIYNFGVSECQEICKFLLCLALANAKTRSNAKDEMLALERPYFLLLALDL